MAEYDGPLALELIGLLSSRFLVIAPRVRREEGEREFGRWLLNVMDGLGVTRASVIAASAFVADVVRFALDEEGRVHRIALLTATFEAALP
jgi:hypothetical protein